MRDGQRDPVLVWRCRDRELRLGERPLLMGIINVTPDSFSDGSRYATARDAVEAGHRMLDAGADILDVGGESTRPGAEAVPADEELRRVIPVIEGLAQLEISGAPDARPLISVDTTKAVVARAAIAAGARIINDVSALLHDADMPSVARESGAGVVLMHMRGSPRDMQERPEYGDVVAEVTAHLAGRVEALVAAGIARECLAVDPGIGFGKTLEHNLLLIAGLPGLLRLDRPVLVGASRKSMIGKLTGRPVGERLAGSLAILAYAISRGAHVLRVHDVAESRDVVGIWAALRAREGL
jgi:dihydropteroate synthase